MIFDDNDRKPRRPIQPANQAGYILMPVVVVITLVAAIALLMTSESAVETHMAGAELDAQQARYVAGAGLNHALWLHRQQGCGPYSDLAAIAFGAGEYSTSLAHDLGATTAYSLTVDQDAWIGSFQTSLNHGGDASLHISQSGGDGETALLRFDLSALPAGAAILSATAWFHVDAGHPEGPLELHRLTADWGEADATWDSMGANLDGAVTASLPPQAATGAWVAVNLTGQVQAWVNGEPNHGLALAAITENVDAVYGSRESANPPYLEVVVGAPPSSPAELKSTAALAGGAAATVGRGDVILRQSPVSFAQIQLGPGAGRDVMLDSFYGNRNHGDHSLDLDNIGTLEHTLIQFELGAIPRGAHIRSARLELYHTATAGSPTAAGAEVFRVTRDWVEGTRSGSGTADGATWDTWDGIANWTQAGGDRDIQPLASGSISAAVNDWESWEIAALVQGWVDGRYPNQGLLLKGTGDTEVSFASKEDTDPALRPKLTVRYACECGQVCVAPRGSLSVLMVVGDDSVPTPGDQAKKDLFESWGYTVDLANDNTSATALVSAMNARDVLYVAASATESAVGTKLTGLAAPVVSELGALADEIGFAAGANSAVGDSGNIVDSDHYITRLFTTGPLTLYRASMAQGTLAGAPAPELRTLATFGGASGLAVLDKGNQLASGGAAPARRVMLPFAPADNFNWDFLNDNGRVLVQRALAWGAGAEPTVLGEVLLVMADPAAPGAGEAARLALIESWDYAVTPIDDDDSQAAFDAAFAIHDAVYVPQEIDATILGSKLRDAPIGVVNEDGEQVDELGFGGDRIYKIRREIDVLDNTHYITEPFATGLLAFALSDQPVHMLSSGQAPGLQTLGQSFNTGSLWRPSLATLDPGDELSGGGPAAGRRVQLPWGDGGFDINALTADGETIMRRALEWAAEPAALAPPLAHWKLDETAGPTAVDSEGGHDGTLAGGAAWAPGMLAGGLYFDGVDDAVDIGVAPGLDNLFAGEVTLSGWIYAGGWGAGQYGRIADKSNAPSPGAGWAFELHGPNQALLFQAAFSGGPGSWATPAGSISLDTWHHVALVYDGSSAANDPRIYIDGALQTVIRESAPSGSPTDDSPYNLALGNHATAPLRAFDGILDDIRLHDRLLLADEIAALAARPGPRAHWRLDETAGPTAFDSAGGHHGTWRNGPAAAAGVVDGGLAFDGSDDHVDVAHDDNLSLTSFTLYAWIRPDALSGWQVILNKGTSTSAVNYYLATNGDEIGFGFYNDGWVGFATAAANLLVDEWYHVVATYDDSLREGRIYLDGAPIHDSIVGKSPLANSDNLTIGRSGFGEFWAGALDDIRLYDRVLGAGEIADLYAANSPQARQYTERHQPWSAGSPDSWEVMDLSPFGVPAGAVVEVAVIQEGINGERWGGVRAVGSSLERRFALHEAEGGGADALTMHVQVDAGSRIEHYSDNTGQVSFILLGYWTGVAYEERFDSFQAGAAASWVSHNLGAYGVGANQVAEIALTQSSTSIEWQVGLRETGSTLARQVSLHEAEGGGVDAVSMMVQSDASALIEVYAEADTVVDFTLLGYWSTAPGLYVEAGGLQAQGSVADAWHEFDLGAWGIPGDAVAQLLVSNEVDNSERMLGIREVGSAHPRVINLQEAESGGADSTALHVNVDGDGRVEFFVEAGTAEHLFRPLGWWVLP